MDIITCYIKYKKKVKKDLSEEAKAAIVAVRIYDGAKKLLDQEDFNSCTTVAFGKVLRKTRENGTVTEDSMVENLLSRESKKKIIARTKQNKEELETAYLYYIENYHKIPEEFILASQVFTRECVIAYYVASKKEADLRKIYANKNEA